MPKVNVGNGKSPLNVIGVGSGEGKNKALCLINFRNTAFYETEISPLQQTAKSLLDTRGVPYQSYERPSHMDITEYFTEGDQSGELLLDFLTEVLDFSRTASPELRQGVLRLLRDPQCSVKTGGRVLFNNNMGVIVLDALS